MGQTLGRWDIRLAVARHWMQIDPLNPIPYCHVALSSLIVEGGVDRPRAMLRQARELGDLRHSADAEYMMALVLGETKRLPEMAETLGRVNTN